MNYVGADLHKKTITLCVMDQHRNVLGRKTLYCVEPYRILEYLESFRPFEIVVEATASYLRWLSESRHVGPRIEPRKSRENLPRPQAQRMRAGGTPRSSVGRLGRARSTEADGERGCAGTSARRICTASLDRPPLIDGFVLVVSGLGRTAMASFFRIAGLGRTKMASFRANFARHTAELTARSAGAGSFSRLRAAAAACHSGSWLRFLTLAATNPLDAKRSGGGGARDHPQQPDGQPHLGAAGSPLGRPSRA